MCVILRNDLFGLCEMEGAKCVRNDKSCLLSLGLMDSRTVDVQCAHNTTHITSHHNTTQQATFTTHTHPPSHTTSTPNQIKNKTRNSMSVCLFVWCCAGNELRPEGAKHLSPAFASMTQMTSLNVESESTHFVNVCDFEE